jgi:non-heme chloroperoxidase
MVEVGHPHLVLWGRKTAGAVPDCRLITVPGIVNPELPALYAGQFGAWFGDPTGPQ